MRRITLLFLLIIAPAGLFAQLKDSERHLIDSLLTTGRLTLTQSNQLYNKFRSLTYPEFTVNTFSGEIEISDTISFDKADKKIICQRSLEWLAINYANLAYSDLESGRIIAHGLIDLSHFEESSSGFGGKNIRPAATSTNYTIILTIKDNRLKYMVTNINYNFKIITEYVDIVTSPITEIYPVKAKGQQWIKYYTVLNASTEMFSNILLNSLVNHINGAAMDYRF